MGMKMLLRHLLCALLACTLMLAPVAGVASSIASDGDVAVEAKAPDAEAAKDRQLRPSGHGNYVKWYQARLKKLGYYGGRLVSLYNRSTYEATKLFQTYNNLPANGIGNKATRDAMFSSSAVTKKAYDEANFLIKISRNAKGAQVSQFQQKLIDYGYLSGAPTSVYDDNTVAACKYFQHANGLKATGAASSETRLLINQGAKIVDYSGYHATSKAAAVKKGDWGLSVYLTMQRLKELGYYNGKLGNTFTGALQKSIKQFEEFHNIKKPDGSLTKTEREKLNADTAQAYQDICGSDTLKPGMSGKAVLKVQVILKQLNFYKGKLDGKYSARLRAAVKKFQKRYGLTQTGVCYSPTVQMIYAKNPISNVPDERATVVIAIGLEQLGKPYKDTASGPSSFDCSGFTQYVFSTAAKISLPHNAKSQSYGKTRILIDDDLLPGDLVFFATGKNLKKINHVGIVTESDGKGNVRFVHSSSAGKKVMVSSFKDTQANNFYQKRFLFGRRVW